MDLPVIERTSRKRILVSLFGETGVTTALLNLFKLMPDPSVSPVPCVLIRSWNFPMNSEGIPLAAHVWQTPPAEDQHLPCARNSDRLSLPGHESVEFDLER